MNPGGAFAVVGPSGAGKDTLIAAAAAACPEIAVIRRVITRPEALGGEPFEGVSPAEFVARRGRGAFALDWQAHGLRYGIPAAAQGLRAAGRTILFNGSRAMLAEAARVFPGLQVVLITAAPAVLAARLAARGREAPEEIAARLARAGAFALPPGLPVLRIDNDGPLAEGAAALVAALGGAQAVSAEPLRG